MAQRALRETMSMKFLHLPLRVEDHRSPEYGEPDWHNGLTIRDKRNICLATVGPVDAAVKDDAEAIANLFAAAPDLFNALEQARAALPAAWAAVKCGVQDRKSASSGRRGYVRVDLGVLRNTK